jgi:multiple sugar transport system ATP-binding protein
MNIKTVPLSESGATFGQMNIPLTREQVSAAQSGGGKVTVGFRPEDTEIVDGPGGPGGPGGGGPGGGAMPIEVDLVEDLGSDGNVYGHAQLDGGAERFVVRTDRRHMPHMGETVYIRPNPRHLHVFNASSGERI